MIKMIKMLDPDHRIISEDVVGLQLALCEIIRREFRPREFFTSRRTGKKTAQATLDTGLSINKGGLFSKEQPAFRFANLSNPEWIKNLKGEKICQANASMVNHFMQAICMVSNVPGITFESPFDECVSLLVKHKKSVRRDALDPFSDS